MSDSTDPAEGKRTDSFGGNTAPSNETTVNNRIFKKASVDHFLKSMKSQVFEEDSGTITNATPGSSLVGPGFVLDKKERTNSQNIEKTRRSSSWAFWQRNNIGMTNDASSSGETDSINNGLKPSSNVSTPSLTPVQDNQMVSPKTVSAKQQQEQEQELEPELDLDKASKVIIDLTNDKQPNDDKDVTIEERTASWSFWSTLMANRSSITNNLSSKLPSSINGTSSDKNDSTNEINSPKRHKTNVMIMGEGAVLSEPSKVTKNSINRAFPTEESSSSTGNAPEQSSNGNLTQADGSNVKASPNIVVPIFEENIPYYSAGCRLATMLESTSRKLPIYNTYDESAYYKKHLYRCEPRSFKRALIIGVHGFFPTKMIRPIIGTPTGTSMRFAQEAEKAVLNWALDHNLEIAIQKIALEKEGKVLDRVDFFLEVMSKWREDVDRADFIFIAAHSQGTPVSIMLLSQLIERNFISDDKIVGILGMAGVNIGPFFGADQTFFMKAYSAIENQSLLELFEFQNFESALSRKYVESLRILIRYGVKITYIGSVNDQLVPLYSAIASHVSHPNIFRGVYIDSTSNTPGFVTRVVKLACELQNLGRSDHGVIKQISNALSGPLTGGGHSRIYSDPNVYRTALNFILTTVPTDTFTPQPVILKPFEIHKIGSNPYTLPWCVRGLFYEVSKYLSDGDAELKLVLKEFEDWKPESKVLKDVKYRLNGIKEIIY